MILQNENPIRMVRELAGTPITLVYALLCVRQRVTQRWLETTTGFSDKTVSKGLAYLREAGLADENSAGWQLIKENAKQLPLTMLFEDKQLDEQESGPESKIIDGNQTEIIQESRRNSDSLNYLNTEVVEDLLINNTSTTSDLNLSDKNGKIPTLEEIQQVLDAAEGLFGNRIMGDPRDYTDIYRLLAWIAKARDGYKKSDKSKIFSPAGLVFWAFHKGKDIQPEKKYLDFDHYDRLFEWDWEFKNFMTASGHWNEDDDDE